jgi:hypothetical protein
MVGKILRQWRRTSMSPGVISRSMCMGMAVGFSPTVGLQAVMCFLIALACNRFWRPAMFDWVIALVGSLVVNPLTMVPTYTFYYWVGCQAITCSSLVEFKDAEHIKDFVYALGDGTLAIFLGSIPFMLIGLPAGYFLGRVIERLLEARAQRRRVRLLEVARRRREQELRAAQSAQ